MPVWAGPGTHPGRARTLLVAVLAAAVVAGYWSLVYQPLYSRLAGARTAVAETRAELERLRGEAAGLAELETQVEALRAELEAMDGVPGTLPAADLLALLARAERETGAWVTALDVAAAQASGATWEHPITLVVSGAYGAQARFLIRLEAAPFPLRVNSAALEGTTGQYSLVIFSAGGP